MKAVNGSFTHPPPLPSREGSFLYDMEPLMKNSNYSPRIICPGILFTTVLFSYPSLTQRHSPKARFCLAKAP